MFKLLQYLFLGHIHKWKVIGQVPYELRSRDGDVLKVATAYTLQCEHCGDLKTYIS